VNLKALFALFILTRSFCGLLTAQEEWINIEKNTSQNSSFVSHCADKDGNSYLVGLGEKATFDNSSNFSTQKLFISKFSSTGQNLWIRPVSNSPQSSIVHSTTNSQGDLYVTGRYGSRGDTVLGSFISCKNIFFQIRIK
jgi:hypothetical protein